MESFFNQLLTRLGTRIEAELKGALSPVGPYLRRLGIGFVILIVSGGLWMSGFTFLAISLFFHFSSLGVYTHASLLTALWAALIGALLTAIGLALLRRPR